MEGARTKSNLNLDVLPNHDLLETAVFLLEIVDGQMRLA